jgi:hypothetical protein
MGGARLFAGRCPRFSPGQTRVLQPPRPLGRRAAGTLGDGPSPLIGHGKCAWPGAVRSYFFGDGDAAGACGAGLAAPPSGGLTPNNSTSKIKVELGVMSGPTARSP